jgi:hypothetical protein
MFAGLAHLVERRYRPATYGLCRRSSIGRPARHKPSLPSLMDFDKLIDLKYYRIVINKLRQAGQRLALLNLWPR